MKNINQKLDLNLPTIWSLIKHGRQISSARWPYTYSRLPNKTRKKDQRYKNGTLKTSLNKWKFNSVFVSPLRADLETCFDIFGEHSGI